MTKIFKVQPSAYVDHVTKDGVELMKLPYPFFADEKGLVGRQDFWNGDPHRVVGFQKDPKVDQVDLWWRDAIKDPSQAVGMYVVTSGKGGMGKHSLPISEMVELPGETEPTATVSLPGAFCGWFDGTSLVYGKDDGDPECKATRLAYEQGRRINAGSGYSVRVTANAMVLRVLIEYGGYCEDANSDVSEQSEVRAARQVVERARAALKTLGV